MKIIIFYLDQCQADPYGAGRRLRNTFSSSAELQAGGCFGTVSDYQVIIKQEQIEKLSRDPVYVDVSSHCTSVSFRRCSLT